MEINMKKYFSVLMVAAALQLNCSVEAQSLDQKIAIAQNVPTILNVNDATAEQLTSLPGIGLKKAEAIIKFRDQNGKFANVDDLLKVKGIGNKMLEKIKQKIAVE